MSRGVFYCLPAASGSCHVGGGPRPNARASAGAGAFARSGACLLAVVVIAAGVSRRASVERPFTPPAMGWTPAPVTASMCQSGSVIEPRHPSGESRGGPENKRGGELPRVFRRPEAPSETGQRPRPRNRHSRLTPSTNVASELTAWHQRNHPSPSGPKAEPGARPSPTSLTSCFARSSESS
jgi:hypothetical protein